ncbi:MULTISPECIES: GNAT family N-acetyltransferase [Providencia]|uniref:GNAT family N-acetyltransferase n=1 Tax=Providencia TaxID=586 RepID=UPI0015EB4E57|nr:MULTISPECIES: GNAT family N-acetyltransferase [Providencia]ELR5137769.1 GNAT family N-acetyltransferase [Providencia rettgeri]ELR5167308.1 GNAT family N-acetyltransferase [Providencia rettgeri]QLQ95195.1 GNAT family N-acetyltransferase [Providencia rettgeri]WEB85799.1 GNAT family N-acetyltransferase [Providencia rettgeri]HCH7937134.1 GNAT family N-acetyltransferase [Providencia rettgeri]
MSTIANNLTYKVNSAISVDDFRSLIKQSPLNSIVPTDDTKQLRSMIENANLLISVWLDQRFIAYIRAITDFSFCCYISEMIIHNDYQNNGIGTQLIQMIATELPTKCSIIFLSTEETQDYYLKQGFNPFTLAWHTRVQDLLDKQNISTP